MTADEYADDLATRLSQQREATEAWIATCQERNRRIAQLEKALMAAQLASGKRLKGCTAETCTCAWLKFHAERTNAKLKKGSVTA